MTDIEDIEVYFLEDTKVVWKNRKICNREGYGECIFVNSRSRHTSMIGLGIVLFGRCQIGIFYFSDMLIFVFLFSRFDRNERLKCRF